MITIPIILVIISAISMAVMDTLAHHYHDSVFNRFSEKFWNPAVSGANKWKKDGRTPRFFLSSTLFVFTTEAWHVFKLIFLVTIIISCIMAGYLSKNAGIAFLYGLGGRAIFGVVFTLFYKWFRRKSSL